MTFHVACPVTCRRICSCDLGFPRRLQSENGKNDFFEKVAGIELFLNDPWLVKVRENATVQVEVPKVAVSLPPPSQFVAVSRGKVGVEAAAATAASVQVKRVELQKQVAGVSVVAEDYARRLESGGFSASIKDASGGELGQSNTKVICRLCFCGKNGGSERAGKMLSCNTCGKKYHRSCLKTWSKYRDLFHWSSWNCPSCRTCEVCHKTGDPNKFMFCKRCDGAYHCYCQQPPHKNIGRGPYLCPKHTKCYSCGSSVPGNGTSVRWFLGYTCCDACGRLFVKENYCPVCLKVYRDSESTPMVCCDICQHWVHCPCDGISDAKYMQFQDDGSLQYVCPACRGECCHVRNLEEAVQELWKRKDEADRDLIATLRANSGLPILEEIFDILPFSDDKVGESLSNNEYSRSFKFSLKGIGDKSVRKTEKGKDLSKKKYNKKKGNEDFFTSGTLTENFGGRTDGASFGYSDDDNQEEEIQISGKPGAGVCKYKYVDEVTAEAKASRAIEMKNKKRSYTNREDSGAHSKMLKAEQGPKLVIHLGAQNRSTNSPPSCEASSLKNGQELASSNVCTRGTGQMEHRESIERTSTATKFWDKKAGRDITYTRGHRSKRRRPAQGVEDASKRHEDKTVEEFIDANWILQKLGKNAAGKRVEINRSSNNTWHTGTVIEVVEGTAMVSIALDDGKVKNFEFGKQGIRFVSKKQEP